MSRLSNESFAQLVDSLSLNRKSVSIDPTNSVEILRAITEALIWSDQNNQDYYKYHLLRIFEEKNILSTYFHLLRMDPDKTITIQLIQSANLLIHNLKNVEFKEYLLRSQFYKEVLSYPFDFTDDDIIENYLSLLKGLAVNTTIEQLTQYLLDNNFTLFTGAVMFFNYSESLIKTASRTVVLRVLSGSIYIVNDWTVERFIMESGFFYNLINNIKESIANVVRSSAASKSLSRLESSVSEVVDLLYHINDIFDIGKENVCNMLYDIIMRILILPILAGSIIEEKPKSFHLPLHLCLFIFSHLIQIIKYPMLIEDIISLLFSPVIQSSYIDTIKNPPNRESPPLEKSIETAKNPVYSTIFSFLNCKEDNLLGITLNLIQSAFEYSIYYFLSCSPDQTSQERHAQILTLIGNLLLAEEEFRFFTVYLACKILFDLSACYRITEGDDLVNDIITAVIHQRGLLVLEIIEGGSPMAFIKKFQQQWDFVNKLLWLSRLELPLNYILPAINESSSNIPLEYRRSISDSDITVNLIRLFLLTKKLKTLLIPTRLSDNSYEIFPLNLLSQSQLSVGQVYHLAISYLKDKSIIKVSQIQDHGRNSPKAIIEDPNFFILGQLSGDYKTFTLEILLRFSKLCIIPVSEPNILSLRTDSDQSIILRIADMTSWLNISNKLERRIKFCREDDLMLLKSFIQDNR